MLLFTTLHCYPPPPATPHLQPTLPAFACINLQFGIVCEGITTPVPLPRDAFTVQLSSDLGKANLQHCTATLLFQGVPCVAVGGNAVVVWKGIS